MPKIFSLDIQPSGVAVVTFDRPPVNAVSEAVYLADTIYVLSHRPARILHRVDVPAFPIRDVALKSSGEFRAVEKQLLELLYAGAVK